MRSEAMATHYLLFGMTLVLFSLVLKLISTGIDPLVLLVALFGVVTSWYGLRVAQMAQRTGTNTAEPAESNSDA